MLMKIAFFTPLNPVQSGISDYSEELLVTLAGAKVGGRHLQIDIFIDKGNKPTNREVIEQFKVLPASDFRRLSTQYDATVYQMGNSAAHASIYNELMRSPGVVVMHEFVLHHLRVWMTLNGGKRKEYISMMEQRHGIQGREAAQRVLLGQFPESLFEYPLSDEVIRQAKGVIVHSRYMEGLVRQVRPVVPLAVVPMGVPLPPLIPKDEARARLGIDPDLFLVTSVGHLNPYKRVSTTLRAFKALLMDVPRSLYLLVGSRSPNYDPTRQIDMLGLSDKVRFTGYVSPEDFPYYLAASDVCLNLRYPTAGETSASLLRIMGAGVPVLVSRTGSFEELPDSAAGKIDIGDIEEELLLEYLLLLSKRPDLRDAMSHAAREYVAQNHTLEQAALDYLNFLAPGVEVELAPQKAEGRRQEAELVVAGGRRSEVGSQSLVTASTAQNLLLAQVAEVAAEIGITEEHDIVLRYVSAALEGIVLPLGDNVAG